MNVLWIIASVLGSIAFFAHAIVGDKELQELKPDSSRSRKTEATYIQTRCGWHWVSVDLFLCSLTLAVLGLTDLLKSGDEIALLLSLYFLICGVVWLVTVLLNKTENKQAWQLSQWIFCFLMSGLIYLGR